MHFEYASVLCIQKERYLDGCSHNDKRMGFGGKFPLYYFFCQIDLTSKIIRMYFLLLEKTDSFK